MARPAPGLLSPTDFLQLYAAMSSGVSRHQKEHNILVLSYGTSIILLLLYVLYLFFQLRTHATLFDAEAPEGDDGEEEEEEPQLSPWAAGAVLLVVTIAVAVCAEYLVGSIDSLVETSGISKTFIGLILLPIVGNAAEHVTAIVVAVKDKMDLAMGVAIGSSMQIALLVTPSLVLLGWAIGVNMTLHFETFETVVFFLSVLVVSYVIQDGKSNYLEGAMVRVHQRLRRGLAHTNVLTKCSSWDFTSSSPSLFWCTPTRLLPTTPTKAMRSVTRQPWSRDLSGHFLGTRRVFPAPSGPGFGSSPFFFPRARATRPRRASRGTPPVIMLARSETSIVIGGGSV